jgi:hypothetical protein
MKYVLIWVLATTNGTGTASQEFETEAACERAAEILNDYRRVDRAFCVPKGDPVVTECAANRSEVDDLDSPIRLTGRGFRRYPHATAEASRQHHGR